LRIERVEFALSAVVGPPGESVETMKKAGRKKRDASDELRPEYDFDYSNAKPNPYAARLKGRAVAVVLDPDVAEVFPTSESVNTLLRSVVAAVPRRSKARKSSAARSGRTKRGS
jgi:hypothetical protein